MGMWAEIKHALNSTLGTSSFKPLNEIISSGVTTLNDKISSSVTTLNDKISSGVTSLSNSIAELKKLLEDIKNKDNSLAPSDSIYKTMSVDEVSVSGSSGDGPEYVKIGSSFTANVDGSVRIIAELQYNGYISSNNTSRQFFYIVTSQPEGEEPDYVARIEVPNDTAEKTTFTTDINITKGTTYSFYIGTEYDHRAYNITSYGVWIGAIVINGSLIS